MEDVNKSTNDFVSPAVFLQVSESTTDVEKVHKIASVLDFSQYELVPKSDLLATIEGIPVPVVAFLHVSSLTLEWSNLIEDILRKVEPCKLSVIVSVEKGEMYKLSKLTPVSNFDFIIAPTLEDELSNRLQLAQNRLEREISIKELGLRDGLTDLITRSVFIERANQLYASALRSQVELSFLLISIDSLEGVSLRFGQNTSDKVLAKFAEVLKLRARETDLLCRYSDTVFGLLTVNMDISHLDDFVQELMEICLAPNYKAGLITLNVSVNIGVTTNLGHSLEDMLTQGNLALEQSRIKGSNQLTVFNDLVRTPVPVRSTMP